MTSDTQIPTRVVLLGASNLSLGWPRLADSIAKTLPAPLSVYTAHGMGRSYCGERSGFAFWQLPGILKCGIWDELTTSASREGKCYALITDLGNDLVYGKTPAQVETAARECVDRLRRWNADCEIVMTRPPTASVQTVGWLRFGVCRWILFPKCPLSLSEVKDKTAELDHRLVKLATDLNVPITGPQPGWYGLDPIHVKRKHQRIAFAEMIQQWQNTDAVDVAPVNFHRRPKANVRWSLGRKRLVAQPSVELDAVKVFAY